MSNFDIFEKAYAKNLAYCLEHYPQDYIWDKNELPAVLARMHSALLRMSFNKDSRAIRMTCKEIGVPHTYKAIKEYLRK